MTVYDESWNPVEDPDPALGRIETRARRLLMRYEEESPGRCREEVVAEYPETGGKDVEIVVDVEEQGHWETRLEDGRAADGARSAPTTGCPPTSTSRPTRGGRSTRR